MTGRLSCYLSFFYFTDKGALLDNSARADIFNQMWVMANPDSFLANNDALIAYNKDSRDKG
ncbi:glutamate synthase (NADPH), partial [marine sediment metagenome]